MAGLALSAPIARGSHDLDEPANVGQEPAVDRERFPYRMKDLCEKTGLPRQVIHFYIAQGLVPEGRKTGRNMAYYGDAHVERVLLVRRLQHERLLPLKAIRALLDERDEAFDPAQRQLVRDVQAHLGPNLRPREERPATIDAGELLEKLGLSRDDLDGLVEIGLLATVAGDGGRTLIAQADAWLLELWADVRRAGFAPELGFETRDLAVYEEAISAMFARETQLIASRVAHLPPARVAEMVDRAIPLINVFLARYHLARVRDFFAAL
jgi:DNA-binding transcriptional MerR regulator